jgi:hypothetical protein
LFDLSPGSWPDWIQSIATVGALVFAGLAAKAAIRTSNQQSTELEAMRRDELDREGEKRRSQAAQVGIWLDPHTERYPDVFLYNASRLPVYDTTVQISLDSTTRSRKYAVRIPNSAPHVLEYMTQELRSALTDLNVPVDDQFELISMNRLAVKMCFMDSSGAWWSRTNKGKLMHHSTQAEAEGFIQI